MKTSFPAAAWSKYAPAIAWASALAARAVIGTVADPILFAVAAVLAVWRRPRLDVVSLSVAGLAVWSLLSILCPRPGGWPGRLAVPLSGELAPAAMSPHLSLAPWETWRWATLWSGAALVLAVVTSAGRAERRIVLTTWTWSVAAIAAAALVGQKFVNPNPVSILLAAAAAPTMAAAVGGDAIAWLRWCALAAGVGVLGAWSGMGLFSAASLAGFAVARGWPRGKACMGAAATLGLCLACFALLDAVWLHTGEWRALAGRWRLWQASAQLGVDAMPWGVGFGAYRWTVLPYITDLAAPSSRALHPESGPIWLWVEGGLPAVVLVLVAAWRLRPRKGKTAQSARWGAAVMGAAALIDVPWLWGPVWWSAALLVAMGWSARVGEPGAGNP